MLPPMPLIGTWSSIVPACSKVRLSGRVSPSTSFLPKPHEHDVRPARLEHRRFAGSDLDRGERPHLGDAILHDAGMQLGTGGVRARHSDQPVALIAARLERHVDRAGSGLRHRRTGPGVTNRHRADARRRLRPGQPGQARTSPPRAQSHIGTARKPSIPSSLERNHRSSRPPPAEVERALGQSTPAPLRASAPAGRGVRRH